LTDAGGLLTNRVVSESLIDAWFYTTNGERLGPVSKDQLCELAATGQLNPRLDLCWTKGMPEWLPAGEIDGLFEKKRSEEDGGGKSSEQDLPRHPQVLSKLSESELELKLLNATWPGANRRVYLLACFLLPILVVALSYLLQQFIFNAENPDDARMLVMANGVLGIVFVIATILVALMRFQNLGMSRLWFLASFVPLLNLWVGYRMICCPAGYEFHRKMDGAGIFLAVLYWGWFLLFAVVFAVIIIAMLGLGFGGIGEMVEGGLQEMLDLNEGGAPSDE